MRTRPSESKVAVWNTRAAVIGPIGLKSAWPGVEPTPPVSLEDGLGKGVKVVPKFDDWHPATTTSTATRQIFRNALTASRLSWVAEQDLSPRGAAAVPPSSFPLAARPLPSILERFGAMEAPKTWHLSLRAEGRGPGELILVREWR